MAFRRAWLKSACFTLQPGVSQRSVFTRRKGQHGARGQRPGFARGGQQNTELHWLTLGLRFASLCLSLPILQRSFFSPHLLVAWHRCFFPGTPLCQHSCLESRACRTCSACSLISSHLSSLPQASPWLALLERLIDMGKMQSFLGPSSGLACTGNV